MRKILLLFLTLLTFRAFSQDPPSQTWNIIKTPEFNIIYPNGYDSVAQKCATMLKLSNTYIFHSLKHKPFKITIVLHNQSVTSNASVAIAPTRSEFWHTPPQESLSPLEWNAGLILHEYRHVVQYSMIKKGYTGLLLYLYWGDWGLALKSITTPDWFYEGDAVATETALSLAGRGRTPDFNKDLRAQILDKEIYSYSKATLGSYKDYVPNHYILGYHLVSYGRYKWNASIWAQAHQNSATILGFTPFSSGLRKSTGYSKYRIYEQALHFLKHNWDSIAKTQSHIQFDTIGIKKSIYTNYIFPQAHNNSIIALKKGMGNIPTIVQIDSTHETTLLEIASQTGSNPIQINNEKIIWVDEIPDLRWSERSFSDIRLFDISSKKQKRLTYKQHYYAPSLSPDGTKIATVEVTSKGIYNLVILDAQSGCVTKKIQLPHNEFIQTPSWSSDNKTVCCILLNKDGNALSTINTESTVVTTYIKPVFYDISNPVFYNQYILFASTVNGINNEIYAIDTLTKQFYQVTNTNYGCRFPSVNNHNLYFSTYTADGYIIGHQTINNNSWKPFQFEAPNDDILVKSLSKDEIGIPNLFDTTQTVNFKKTEYPKIMHIFNPHTWGLNVSTNNSDNSRTENNVSVISQDKLGTTQIIGGYRFDNLGSKKGFLTILYYGLYPVIQFDFINGLHGYLPYWRDENEKTTKQDTLYTYEYKDITERISFPFNLSRGNYYRTISIGLSNHFTRYGKRYYFIKNEDESKKPYSKIEVGRYNRYYDYLEYSISASNIKYYSQKDIQPKWGQLFQIGRVSTFPIKGKSYKTKAGNDIIENKEIKNRYYVIGTLYFPGLLKYHGIKLNGGYTKQSNNSIYYVDIAIPFARGYINEDGSTAQEFYTFSANYNLTLLNPDLPIGPIAYIKRITSNFFFDYTSKDKVLFKSYGVELSAETHILNIKELPLHIGIRISNTELDNSTTYEPILGFSF